MKKKLTIMSIATGAILFILALLNPSLQDFKEFVPSVYDKSTIEDDESSVSRSSNWLIFSVYTFSYECSKQQFGGGYTTYWTERDDYYGFLNNFFKKN